MTGSSASDMVAVFWFTKIFSMANFSLQQLKFDFRTSSEIVTLLQANDDVVLVKPAKIKSNHLLKLVSC